MSDLKDALKAYQNKGIYPFHMPGHKRQPLDFPNPYCVDITEIDGFDNLHHAEGILKEGQERAAQLYGSKECFYLVNGSTCGILAAVSAAAKRGEKVLVARNCHKAVYHALFLRELCAVYLYPSVTENDIQGQITPEQVKEAFLEHPDIAAVIITSPTYEGIVSDVEQIARVAHSYDVPLIVDEAHGAHFGFGAGFPENAVCQGADAVIMSLHKTLPAFTQTALLHLCSGRISSGQVKKYLDIYETSSPSYVLMAGIEACISKVTAEKESLFFHYRRQLDEFYDSVRDLVHLHVMNREDVTKEEAFDWDDSKIVIFAGDSGMTGEILHQRLLGEYRLQMEMASGSYVLAMTSVMDMTSGFKRLSAALHEMDKIYGAPLPGGFTAGMYRRNPKEMEIYQAWNLPAKEVSFSEAVGKMSADYLCLYPPGIPIIVPGEIITEALIENIWDCIRKRLRMEGSANLSSGRINVVYF